MRRLFRHTDLRLSCLVCVIAIGFANSAAAQIAGQQEPGQQEPGPYDAKGLPLGGFRLFPTLGLDANFDDNVYRKQAGTKSDYYFLENPAFMLQSEWSRHELDFYGGLNAYQYSSLTSENHNDWNVGGDGRLDVLRGIDLMGGASYAIEHEARTSPDQPGYAKDPTQYALTQANGALEYHPYHFGFTLGGTFAQYNYDPTTLIGLPPLNNDDRNRDEYVGYAKASYEFSPGYAVFLQADDRNVNYAQTVDRTGVQRSNDGYSTNVGLDMAVTHLIQGQIFVGYLNERYHAPLVGISGFNFGANVDWEPTRLWTLHLTASRILNGTTIAGASAQDDQTVKLAADFKPRPNLMFQGYIGYDDEVFNGSSRSDKYTSAGINLNYSMNQYMSAQMRYDYQTRNSTITGQGFSDNLLSIGLNLHL